MILHDFSLGFSKKTMDVYEDFLIKRRKLAEAAGIVCLQDTDEDTFRLTICGKITEHFGNAKTQIITVTAKEISIVDMDYVENLETNRYQWVKERELNTKTPNDLSLCKLIEVKNRPDGDIVSYRDGIAYICEWMLAGTYGAKLFFTMPSEIKGFLYEKIMLTTKKLIDK